MLKTWVRAAAIANASNHRPQDGRTFAEDVPNPTAPLNAAPAPKGGLRPLPTRGPPEPVDHSVPAVGLPDSGDSSNRRFGERGEESGEPSTTDRRGGQQSLKPPRKVQSMPRRMGPRSPERQGRPQSPKPPRKVQSMAPRRMGPRSPERKGRLQSTEPQRGRPESSGRRNKVQSTLPPRMGPKSAQPAHREGKNGHYSRPETGLQIPPPQRRPSGRGGRALLGVNTPPGNTPSGAGGGTTQNPPPSGHVPKLTPEQQSIVDFYNLGTIEPLKDASRQPIPGRYTFSGGPDGRWFTKEEMPDLLFGLAFERLDVRLKNIEARLAKLEDQPEVKPEPPGLNSSFQYGQNKQSFQLLIIAPGVAFDYPKDNWIFNAFTKAVYQPVVGFKKSDLSRLLFFSFRWSPIGREQGYLGPDRKRVEDISVALGEFHRAKKALFRKFELHIDFAYDMQEKSVQIFVRAEGNLKASLLGCFWQVSRIWSRFRDAPATAPPQTRWEKVMSYCGILRLVKEMSREREQAALAEGQHEVKKREALLQQKVYDLAAEKGEYAAAKNLGITVDLDLKETSKRRDLPPEYRAQGVEPGGQVQASVPVGKKANGWRISFPMVVTALPGGRRTLTVRPAVNEMLKQLGVPVKAIDDASVRMSPEQRKAFNQLETGVTFVTQISKAIEGAAFANFYLSPGTAFAGLFLDMGLVLPIVVVNFPFGTGGAVTNAQFKAGVVFPLYVVGISIQIFGNRSRSNTAGIVIR